MKTLTELLHEGHRYQQQGRLEEAAQMYRQILRVKPKMVAAIGQLGIARIGQGRLEEALDQFDEVVRLDPDSADNHNNRGLCLLWLGCYEEAAAAFRRAWELKPDLPFVLGNYAYLRRGVCEWEKIDELSQQLTQAVREGHPAVSPLYFLEFSDNPADLLACARKTAAGFPSVPRPRHAPRGSGERIRLAYLSADFRNHATGHIIAELIERHDRSRFEVTAISVGPDDGSSFHKRLEAAFDRFLDLRQKSSDDIAHRISSLGIDILVDLMGHIDGNRLEALAQRPAPIQVNYFGHPGTSGADFVDYIIVDPFIVPADQQPFFSERLVHLPDCYQPNDTKRAVAEETPKRAECGLPAEGFVFASFNTCTKITPEIFDVWMRLLKAVPGSVLWQLAGDGVVRENLRREAAARGGDPARIVFAPAVPLDQHLARHRIADLFLDTRPWNAHVTASQALWMGLPIVTCAGRSFQCRVAGSLLTAIGLADLVTETLGDYEKLALALATKPERLKEVRERLARNRDTAPLFDIDRYRRHIEAAYETMMEIRRRGEAARAFAVEPIQS